jgi:hypothetical protein
MFPLLLVVFPLLFLFNPYLAMAGLVTGIAGLYFQRTRGSNHQTHAPRSESVNNAGYED